MTRQRRKRAEPTDWAAPAVAQETALALEALTDRAAFQSLCDAVLSSHFGYRIHIRGVNPRGTVVGQPDSWGHDPAGNLCAFEYGTDRYWRKKLHEDLESVSKATGPEFEPTVFVFCTNRHVDASSERTLMAEVRDRFGWELRLHSGMDLATVLDTDLQDIRYRYLGIRISRHTWTSLLEACQAQRQSATARYAGKYDPDLYVERRCEELVDHAYRRAVDDIVRGEPRAELIPVVDQAGAGKSNLAVHLAELYGKRGPVLLLPGSLAIADDHAFEREITLGVGYADDGRSYQADLDGLYRLALARGRPFLLILDGVNERQDPERVRSALAYLLNTYHDKPLLVLLTCRDAVWHHLTDPLWRHFAHPIDEGQPDDITVLLDPYDDEEFRKACDRYFARWDVEATFGLKAAEVVRSPLMLRIFSEVHQGRRLGHVVQVVAGDLWNAYHDRKIRDIYEGLGRRLREDTIVAAVEQIATRMLDHGAPLLRISDLADIRGLDIDDNSASSLFIRLKDASVLLEDQAGTIRFMHEPFLEFVLARSLANELAQPATSAEALNRVASLASGDRWRHVPLHVAALADDVAAVIERIQSANLWFAALAVLQNGPRVSATTRAGVIQDLVAQLESPYTLDRMRAAELLGRLGASETIDALRQYWVASGTPAALKALARLGAEDTVDTLVHYLGRQQSWYRDDDQELVNILPPPIRARLKDRAGALLLSAHGRQAAHVLGYLGDADAVPLLRTALEMQDWTDHVALTALLRIGTPEALAIIEHAMEQLGTQALAIDAKVAEARRDSDDEAKKTLDAERHRYLWALTELRVHGLQHSVRTRVVPLLRRLLQHPNRYVRLEVLTSLQHIDIENDGDIALDIIKSAALVGDDWFTLSQLMQTVQIIAPHVDAAPIIALLSDGNLPVNTRQTAVAALGATKDQRALIPLVEVVEHGDVNVAAIQALGRLGDPRAVPTLANLLGDGSNSERGAEAVETELAVEALGRLHDPSAFAPLENYARTQWPNVSDSVVEALVATGRERAIPLLVELWSSNQNVHDAILKGLLWLGTDAATGAVLSLLDPSREQDIALLAHSLFHDKQLFYVGGGPRPRVDDRIVQLIEAGFDRLAPVQQQLAIWALGDIASARALRLLEHVATSGIYDVPIPSTGSGETQTVRDTAINTLRHMSSSATVHTVIDDLVGPRAMWVDHDLAKIDRRTVLRALQSRLRGAGELLLVRILELLGWFGDESVLEAVRSYCTDARPAVANAAYEAEQRILGLADLVFTSEP